MRPLMLALLLFASLLATPSVAAQDLAPATTIDDPTGDQAGPLPAAAAPFVDLTHAEIQGDEASMALRVTVADLPPTSAAGLQWELWLHFVYRDTPFDLTIFGQPPKTLPDDAHREVWGDLTGVLYRLDGETYEFPTEALRTSAGLDVPGRTFNVTVPWTAIVGTEGRSPLPGETLRLLEVRSAWAPTLLGSPHQPLPVASAEALLVTDTANFPEGTFLSVPGAIGDLSLATTLPVRSSNGEATTFHWPVEVGNKGARELDVTFKLDAGAAEGHTPPGLRLAPGANATVNVYVTVPFAHDHGTTASFPLTATAGPEDVAILRLGVDYPAIPQPAGHHPDLWLHGRLNQAQGQDFTWGEGWMNTVETDERANTDLLMPSEENCPSPVVTVPTQGDFELFELGAYWAFPVRPSLAIGLDARTAEAASLDLTLAVRAATPDATLYGRLVMSTETFDGFGPFANVTDPYRAAVAIPASGPGDVALHLDLPVPPAMDRVAPSRSTDLFLALILCQALPPGANDAQAAAAAFGGLFLQSPYAIRAGHLELPLDEYHDILPIAPSAAGLTLEVEDPVRRAAPGSTVVWHPTLRVPANGTGAYAVRLFGTGADAATLRGPDVVQGPDAVQLPVSFVVPDAPAGHVFDLLLDVTHQEDPSRSVGLRLSVVVDPNEPRDDAVELASLPEKGKESPSVALGLSLLGLAALAVMRRRA